MISQGCSSFQSRIGRHWWTTRRLLSVRGASASSYFGLAGDSSPRSPVTTRIFLPWYACALRSHQTDASNGPRQPEGRERYCPLAGERHDRCPVHQDRDPTRFNRRQIEVSPSPAVICWSWRRCHRHGGCASAWFNGRSSPKEECQRRTGLISAGLWVCGVEHSRDYRCRRDPWHVAEWRSRVGRQASAVTVAVGRSSASPPPALLSVAVWLPQRGGLVPGGYPASHGSEQRRDGPG